MQFYYNIRWVRDDKGYPKVNGDQSKRPPVKQKRSNQHISNQLIKKEA